MSDESVRGGHGRHVVSEQTAPGRHHGVRGGNTGRQHQSEDSQATAGASLYFGGLGGDGRRRLELALTVKGLANEIALLRVKIAEQLDKGEQVDLKRVEGLVTLLVKAVATEHRLSQQHQDELYQSVLNVIQGLGEAAGLDGAGDVSRN